MSSDDTGAAVKDALIREGVALAVMVVVVWYFGPGRLWLQSLRHRAVALWTTRDNAVDRQVREFRSDVSRWEHEQTAQADRKPAGDDPCGCG